MKKFALVTLVVAGAMFAWPAMAADCVEVDIELPANVTPGPGVIADGYFELTNCGDDAATIDLADISEVIKN